MALWFKRRRNSRAEGVIRKLDDKDEYDLRVHRQNLNAGHPERIAAEIKLSRIAGRPAVIAAWFAGIGLAVAIASLVIQIWGVLAK